MAITYEPVSIPGFGNVDTSGATTVGTSLAGLGDKITGLGDRRQKRIDDETARKNARGLGILEMAAANVESEEELNAIAGSLGLLPGGSVKDAVVIPGGAEVINATRARLIENNGNRGIAEFRQGQGKEAEAVGRTAQSKADLNDLEKSAATAYGPQIADVLKLGHSNDPGYKDALYALNADMQKTHAGIDPNKLYQDSEANRTLGDTTNTGIVTNELGIESTRETNDFNKKANVFSLGAKSDANRDSDYNYGRTILSNTRADESYDSGRNIKEFVADLRVNGVRDTDNIQSIRNNPDFTAAEKEEAITLYGTGPGLDVTNPLKDEFAIERSEQSPINPVQNSFAGLSNTFFGTDLPTNESRGVPIQQTVSGIEGAVERSIAKAPDIQTYADAQRLREAGTLKDFAGNIGEHMTVLYPDYDWEENHKELINEIKSEFGFSNEEIVALVGQATNTGGFFNSAELADDKMRKRAAAYAATLPNIKRDYEGLMSKSAEASVIQSNIRQKKIDQQRAAENGKPEDAAKRQEEIDILTSQLLRIEADVSNRARSTKK
jgi:hypothetical protein